MNLRIRRIRRIVVAVIVLMALLCSEALAGSIPCYINSNTKIYNRPWTSADSLNVRSGTACYMVACQGNWALVSRDGLQAFIPLPYLTLANRITAYASKDTVLYASASTSSAKSPTLTKGTTVYIIGRSGNFYRVQNENGSITGYMEASALTGTKPTVTRAQGYTSQDTLLYASASTSSRSIKLSRRTPVYVIGKSGNFYCVQNYEGTVTGYILAGHVTDKDPGPAVTRVLAYAAQDTQLYAGPSTSSAKSYKIARRTPVYVIGQSGSFYCVQNYEGTVTGYLVASHVTDKDPGPEVTRIPAYAAQDTILFSGPSTSSSQTYRIARGTVVYIIGQSGGFFCVQNYEGTVTGYLVAGHVTDKDPGTVQPSLPGIDSSLLSTTSTFSAGMSNAQKLEYVIYVAQNLYGRPYASDANPPESFDCSRYVKYCFAQANVSLPSSAKTQGYDGSYATISSTGSLRRGDVVCFDTDPSDGDLSDHTGIYLGQGYFIHSSSGAGKVIVSSLVSGYYKDNFSWGRRILD